MRGALHTSLLFGLLCCVVADPAGVSITGATGKPGAANGNYFETNVQYNGHNCYKKEHVKLWLCMDSNDLWNVQVEKMRGGNLGILVSSARNAPSPLVAGPWRVYDSDKEEWVNDEAVSISAAQPTAAPVAMARGAPLDTNVVVVGERLKQTVAAMLFGSFAVAMVSLALAGSTDPHIRSYFFKLLSATMTFLISLLVTVSVWDLLFEQFLPMPLGLGLGYPVKPGVKMVVSFVLFTLSNMALNFVGWKVQFSRARLFMVRTLGAHICACFGIGTFTVIQKEAVFSAAQDFQGPLMNEHHARVFSAFLIVALAWLTFMLYRAAAMGVREEIFKQPPKSPWPAPSTPPVATAAPSSARSASCTSWGATQPAPPPPAKKAPGPDWGAFVNWAEDDACVIVLGYLINQSLTLWVSGELPGLKAVYTYHSETMIKFWIGSIGAFVLLLLLIVAVRTRYGDGGRLGSIVNRTVAMCLSWCVYRAAKWSTSDLMENNHPLMAVQGAFVVSALSVVLMILLDKVLDLLLGRNGHPGLRRMMAHFNDSSDGQPLSERGMRIIMMCMGLLMALAWETAISFSVETIVLQNELLSQHVVISKAVLFIVIGFVMVYPWRRVVLPTSEMGERHLEESIKHELLQMDRAEGFMPLSTA